MGHAARDIAEETAIAAIDPRRPPSRAIAGRESPAIIAIGFKLLWVAQSIVLLDPDCAPAVLEIIASLLAHEAILEVLQVEPSMRELVNEQRSGVEKIVAVEIFPLIGRRPLLIAGFGKGISGRGHPQNIEKHRLAITFPAIMQISGFRFPSLPN